MTRPSPMAAGSDRRLRIAGAGLALAALVAVPAIARSQCVKDTDCKGDRICSAGVCVDATSRKPVKIWALSSGSAGVISAGLTLGMGIAADVLPRENPQDPIAPSVIMGNFMMTTIVMSPITAAGGRSARVAAGVEGERGARVGGWIFYGIGIASVPGLVVVGLAIEGPPPPGWILGSAIACALSQALLAVDAFVSHVQAEALAPAISYREKRAGIVLAPHLAPYLAPGAGGGAVLGLTGSF